MTDTNYQPLKAHIRLVDERNTSEEELPLLGVSINKCFIKSVANTIGTDLAKYKVVRRGQFVCSLMQVSRDDKLPIDCLHDYEKIIVSPAYVVFEVKDESVLLPEYLALWFKRPEFDREASFYAVGGVRGSMEWADFLDMRFPLPELSKQRAIVEAYQIIQRRIELKRKINDNLAVA
jgi:type I restriction enzyme S subunit